MRSQMVRRLDRDECIRLMKWHPARVGRICLAGPRPNIFPVNFAIDRGNVVFRTDAGTKFDAALDEAYVAFETDWVEPRWKSGWSVVVRGQAHVMTDPDEIKRAGALPLLPWADGRKEHFVKIDTTLVSGRRLRGER